jgi:hypothetical protein
MTVDRTFEPVVDSGNLSVLLDTKSLTYMGASCTK